MTATNTMASMSTSGPAMTAPTVGRRELVVVGATGMDGGYSVDTSLFSRRVVVVPARRDAARRLNLVDGRIENVGGLYGIC
jgi:hypothetical protein